MRRIYLALLLGSIALAAASSSAPPRQESSLNPSGNLVLIEGIGTPGEGWLQLAPAGSMVQGPTEGQRTTGLATFPFSELGHTKVLINMDHTSWVYVAGQETTVTHLGSKPTSVGVQAVSGGPISVAGLKGSGFFEVRQPNGITLTLEGNSDYLFSQESFSWMKLPVDAKVSLLKD